MILDKPSCPLLYSRDKNIESNNLTNVFLHHLSSPNVHAVCGIPSSQIYQLIPEQEPSGHQTLSILNIKSGFPP